MDYTTLSNGELAVNGSIGAMSELDRRVITEQALLKRLSDDQLIMRALVKIVKLRDASDVETRALRDELKTRSES